MLKWPNKKMFKNVLFLVEVIKLLVKNLISQMFKVQQPTFCADFLR